MNSNLLKQVAAYILEEPLRLDMRYWTNSVFDRELQRNLKSAIHPLPDPPCGTTACIYGWGFILSKGFKSPLSQDIIDEINTTADQNEVAALFDVSIGAACRLMSAINWPNRFRYRYDMAFNQKNALGAAAVASDRINFFIATGGTDRANASPEERAWHSKYHGEDEADIPEKFDY